MLRLMKERDCLGVVDDQIGTPTWAHGLAQMIWQLVDSQLAGIYHWTDAGVASWYDFAVAIRDEALCLGLIEEKTLISPVSTKQYPTPAVRPPYSVLDKRKTWSDLDGEPRHWRDALKLMLQELQDNG